MVKKKDKQWSQLSSCEQQRLIRLGGCPGWNESSLGARSLYWFCHAAAHLRHANLFKKMKICLFYILLVTAFILACCQQQYVEFITKQKVTRITSIWKNKWSLFPEISLAKIQIFGICEHLGCVNILDVKNGACLHQNEYTIATISHNANMTKL